MPTVRQLFALLREDVEQEAIEEVKLQYGDSSEEYLNSEAPYDNIEDVIFGSFHWLYSVKGYKYWSDIIDNPPLKTQQDA